MTPLLRARGTKGPLNAASWPGCCAGAAPPRWPNWGRPLASSRPCASGGRLPLTPPPPRREARPSCCGRRFGCRWRSIWEGRGWYCCAPTGSCPACPSPPCPATNPAASSWRSSPSCSSPRAASCSWTLPPTPTPKGSWPWGRSTSASVPRRRAHASGPRCPGRPWRPVRWPACSPGRSAARRPACWRETVPISGGCWLGCASVPRGCTWPPTATSTRRPRRSPCPDGEWGPGERRGAGMWR
jgi:hypothetical protein